MITSSRGAPVEVIKPEFPINPELEPEMMIIEISGTTNGMFMQSFMTIKTQLMKLCQ